MSLTTGLKNSQDGSLTLIARWCVPTTSSTARHWAGSCPIIRRAGLKIGFIGLLTDLTRVVDRPIADRITYLDPIEVTNRYAAWLKEKKHCDLVICLSHLGYEKEPFTDRDLVAATRNVDIVIGGHSHTFLETEKIHENIDGEPVLIVTDGCWGLYVGNLKISLDNR